MNERELDPGFLRVFRLFVITQIIFWVVIGPILVVMQMSQPGSPSLEQVLAMTVVGRLSLPNVAPLIAMQFLLLVILLAPQLPRMLGRWFLPLTLVYGLIPLLIGYYWWPSENPLQTPFIIFFFVMLVLISWQYSFRHVFVYVAGLTLYQVWIKEPLQQVPRSVDVGWLLLQGAMMLLVGYVIVQLVDTQRQQRAALTSAFEKQGEANVRLQRYADAVEELTISRERNRLARELHDTLAHSLSAVTVQIEAVRSLWQVDSDAARNQLDRADETARQGLTEARRSVQALRASPLQNLGLMMALRGLAETAAERSGAELILDLPDELGSDLASAVEQGLYRIAQEALENVVRHAEASRISFRLFTDEQVLTMHIEDNGRGLDGSSYPHSVAGGQGGLGLRGMRERASLIGGRLTMESLVNQGTRISLEIPCDRAAAGPRSGIELRE